jgi:putative salt-induced outer membrane protein YdiY
LKLTIITLCAIVSTAALASADVLTLKTGDRITGSLVTIKGQTLTLKSDTMGTLTIPVAKIATYSVEKPVAVIVKGREPMQGILELTPSGDWKLTEKDKTETIPAAKVDTIMPNADYEKLVEATPRLWQAWKGAASLGESIQHGNQETNTFTTTLAAVRERPAEPIFDKHFRTTFNVTALIAHASQDGSNVTTHTLSALLRQDYLLSATNFVFGLAQLDHISTEGLYMRQTYGGGFGRQIVKNPRTSFNVIGGLTAQHEKFFTGLSDETLDGLIGETLVEQINKRVVLNHNLNFYPNFTEGGQYRFDTTTTLAIKLVNKFSMTVNAIDLYLSNPPAGNEKNNITLSLGIGYTF